MYYFKPILMATVVHLVHGYHLTDELPHVLEEPRIPYKALSKRTRSRFANLMLDTAFKVVFGLPACEQTLIDLLEKIAFVFRHSSFLEERPVEFSEDLFKRIFQAAEVANMTSKQYQQYQKDMTTAIDLIAQRDYAHEEGFNEGKREGIIEGMKESEKKREEGKKEGISFERDRIIGRLRDRGMTPEEIHELVGDS